MQKFMSCVFEDAPSETAPPSAVVWTELQYSDKKGWYPLPEHEKFQLKPTRFDDKRIKFLDPVDETPATLKENVTGKYFVKSWSKEECDIAVEGDQRILIKFKTFDNVITYEHTGRLPTFLKAWKPLVFLVNKSLAWVRLTEDLAFVVTCNAQKALSVFPVDYNSGYLCSHPFTDMALAYNAYAVAGLSDVPDCQVMPRIEASSGNWGFWLQFYSWGVMKIPKALEMHVPQALMGAVGMQKRKNVIAFIFVPPKMFLRVELDGPGNTTRTMTHGTEFVLTARKTSDTDIEIYLLMDGQLMKYNHSFDVRINKPEKPVSTTAIKFKFAINKEDQVKAGGTGKFTFKATKEMEVVLAQGGPTGQLGQLMSDQLYSVFDCETCQYLLSPVGSKLCNAFTKIATPVD